ncbi:interleukin 15, like isoform X2 [Thunnus albacares]|uniref:interleukin 15, like isoform X2 n=1 Tax=Thunnus albacares TaxID=8236 RepID=UPI001CF677B8|nr:interleukin 15, like isoform X2 [Thunnus albacares]
MLRGRPTLASVLLCCICLPVLTQGNKLKLCSLDSIARVESLIKDKDLKLLDCMLYTPTTGDYKNCPRSTLNCFADEVNVLIEESNKNIAAKTLFRMLKSLAGRIDQSESECLQCESHKEEKVEKFLSDLLEILKQNNSEHC